MRRTKSGQVICKVRQLLPPSPIKTARIGLLPMDKSQCLSVLQKEEHNAFRSKSGASNSRPSWSIAR